MIKGPGKGTVREYVVLDYDSSGTAFTAAPRNLTMNETVAWPSDFSSALQMLQGRHQVGSKAKVLVFGGATAMGRNSVQL